MLPWFVGFLTYMITVFAAVKAHSPILSSFVAEPSGFSWILFALAWIGLALLLAVATVLITVLMVLITTAVFQTAIVEEVLRHESGESAIVASTTNLSVAQIARESMRCVLTETVKLLWLLPLMIMAFILGFIPLLAPLAFLLGAWLVAFQFVDIVLDVAGLSATKRIGFGRTHWSTLCAFGGVTAVVFLVPLAGILLAPIATAAAAWLLVGSEPFAGPSAAAPAKQF